MALARPFGAWWVDDERCTTRTASCALDALHRPLPSGGCAMAPTTGEGSARATHLAHTLLLDDATEAQQAQDVHQEVLRLHGLHEIVVHACLECGDLVAYGSTARHH